MQPFTVICNCCLSQAHIKLLRVRPNNLQLTIRQIFNSLIDISWIDSFMPDYLKVSLRARVEPTVIHITKNLNNGNLTAVDKNSGELVVSELARQSVVSEYGYLNIPLGELIATQASQNPGFDFYSMNLNNILLFGESKYISAQTAHNSALKQIVNFRDNKKDDKDLITIDPFIPHDKKVAFQNYIRGQKGYIAAFASKNETNDELINKLEENEYFKQLVDCSELICVAIDV